ncbi:MAG: LysM peptidoglycan-binding domain-containing protein [Candidatus Omnitrophica bacterium]|nr:LysM peptidoglycan-binding domain-containing protein [Candidatus Omnitrophota bacterium]
MNRSKLAGICVLTSTLALSGCVARTYNLTRDRVDQELSLTSGNRGYIMGQAPEPQERKTTRTTRVFELELGPTNKTKTSCPAATPLAAGSINEPGMVQETQPEIQPETQTEETNLSSEKYTVAKNDTLQKISKKFYGTTKRWMKVYEANKDVLRGPDKLYPGQILNIPSGPKVSSEEQKMREPKENLK